MLWGLLLCGSLPQGAEYIELQSLNTLSAGYSSVRRGPVSLSPPAYVTDLPGALSLLYMPEELRPVLVYVAHNAHYDARFPIPTPTRKRQVCGQASTSCYCVAANLAALVLHQVLEFHACPTGAVQTTVYWAFKMPSNMHDKPHHSPVMLRWCCLELLRASFYIPACVPFCPASRTTDAVLGLQRYSKLCQHVHAVPSNVPCLPAGI